jgi:phytanoyl-CoA hydroxylase
LTLTHQGLDEAELAAFERSWSFLFDALEDELSGARAREREAFFERVTRGNVHRSRFGGLWPDLRNAETLLDGKLECGLLNAKEGELFRHWIEKGYVVLPGAVSSKAIDRFMRDYDRIWEEGNDELFVEYFKDGEVLFHPIEPRFRDEPHKILDFHGYSEAARRMICSKAIVSFLSKLFERPPMAFQSLLFLYGTEQEMHQDTAFVPVSSPLEFVGSWIALEDIQPNTGELQYYEGSHRLPEFLWEERSRAMPMDNTVFTPFYEHVRDLPPTLGMELRKFTPKKGDVLLWHADLVHGGGKNPQPGKTRKSFVTHWCPKDVDPEYSETLRWSGKLPAVNGGYYCHKRRG